MQPFDCQKDQTKIVDAPLTLTLDTYQETVSAQSSCSKVIPSFMMATIESLDIFIRIGQHRGLSLSGTGQFT